MSSDSYGDRADGVAVLPVQRSAGAGRHWARRGEEGQGDGGSDAAVHQLAGGAQAVAGVRG
jgi:hypothetical protein